MGTNLQQVLRSLCLNSEWKILTWEDGYYDNPDEHDSLENKPSQQASERVEGGHFSHDPLGLAVAKMSYRVYTLGEGIVGQVAVTGKHRWIFSGNQVAGSGSSYEFVDDWQPQFSVGIKTIAVVAVVPLGVVQLGSLNNVIEDADIVTHIRNLFLPTQHYTIGHTLNQIQCSAKNFSPLDVEKIRKSETLNNLMSSPFSDNNLPSCVTQEMAVDMAKHGGSEFNFDESDILLQSMSNMMDLENQKFLEIRSLNERGYAVGTSGCKHVRVESEKNMPSLSQNSVSNINSFEDLISPPEKVGSHSAGIPAGFVDAIVHGSDKLPYVEPNQQGVSSVSRPSDADFQKGRLKSEFQTSPCYKDVPFTMLKFPAGWELHEALGPAFLRRNECCDWDAWVNQDIKTAEMPDEISCSQLTSESRQEHLLEAVVANVHHSNNDANSDLSFCSSVQSGVASGTNPEAATHTMRTINSECYSIDQSSLDKQPCLSSSGIRGVISPKGFSSACHSSCNEQFERSSEPAKNKKRARAGESCRPRPRDRQLIQDRIKELRELVPNGAKCSIDSLLERTIKHMLFLQSITKHADKLNKFADSKTKVHHMEADVLGSSGYEQGSSWAMEVGGHLKVHSILVENLNKNGQMLIEMLCEECTHFLEIAEAIRSLGLTILTGTTEAHGEKTWICFVVEGQNNRNVHRLDILWPLVQMLQSQSTMHSQ
ncbi:transcription factor EMB1444-like isoform X2 [Prosopis cineraria]|uniref:transcription factor EMB1444-like isoform X2 n=1 Tax=Prosopis cineraria TaxID=364024 RepID=UPI00240F2328|nr:transcription factor EMB1444-like isoform X2 [Prosopis cineraria]